MKYITHIHSLKAILIPFFQPQSILQEMGIGTGSELLQPADAVMKHLSIQELRQFFRQFSILIVEKGSPFHLLQNWCIFFIPDIRVIKCQEQLLI